MSKRENVNKRELEKQYGSEYNSILMNFFVDLDDYTEAKEVDFNIYYRMYKTDETVKYGVDFYSSVVISYIGDYYHDNKHISDFVNENFANMTGSFRKALKSIVQKVLRYGFVITEILWKLRNGKVYLNKLISYDGKDISFRFVREGNSLRIKSVLQDIGFNEKLEIPLDKVIYFRNGEESVYGDSQLRTAYKNWRFKDVIIKFWAHALERFGMPIVAGKSANPKSLFNNIKNIHSKTVVTTGLNDEIQYLEAKNTIGDSYLLAINYANKMIYRALFIPSLLESGEKGGSYALGQKHFEAFLLAAQGMAFDLKEVLIEQLIRRLIEYNFGPQEDYGNLTIKDEMPIEEKKVLSDVFFKMVNTGIINPVSDNAWIRKQMGFPEGEGTQFSEFYLNGLGTKLT